MIKCISKLNLNLKTANAPQMRATVLLYLISLLLRYADQIVFPRAQLFVLPPCISIEPIIFHHLFISIIYYLLKMISNFCLFLWIWKKNKISLDLRSCGILISKTLNKNKFFLAAVNVCLFKCLKIIHCK